MAQKTRAQLQAENAALFVENTTGDITPTLEKAYNEDVNDSCMLLAEGTYTTISLVDWTALVAANGLVPGWRYRVTSAYTFDAFGAKDIVVIADSANTVEDTGYVIITGIFVPYTVDSTLSNPGFFLASYPVMALTGTQALAYFSGSNWRFNHFRQRKSP